MVARVLRTHKASRTRNKNEGEHKVFALPFLPSRPGFSLIPACIPADNRVMQASLQPLQSKRAQRRRGFTVMEVALSLVIFTMMTLLFGAVLPIAVRGAKHSGNYDQAAALAQRKIDQLRVAGYSRLFDDSSSTALSKLSAQNVVNAQNGPGVFDFTTMDNLTGTSGYFPPGSTGTITVADGYNGVPAGNAAQVTVTITWTGNVPGSYSASAIIVSMLHQ